MMDHHHQIEKAEVAVNDDPRVLTDLSIDQWVIEDSM